MVGLGNHSGNELVSVYIAAHVFFISFLFRECHRTLDYHAMSLLEVTGVHFVYMISKAHNVNSRNYKNNNIEL